MGRHINIIEQRAGDRAQIRSESIRLRLASCLSSHVWTVAGWPLPGFLLKHRQISRRQILNQADFSDFCAQQLNHLAAERGGVGPWVGGRAGRCGVRQTAAHADLPRFAFGVELPPPPPRFLPSSRELSCALLHAMTLDRARER